MLSSLVFVSTRVFEILILAPTVGMLGWFVDGYNEANMLTPASILVLFIVAVLGLAWTILTLFMYHHHPTTSRLIAVIDIAFIGAFIAGVWYLRGIRYADCTSLSRGETWTGSVGDFTISGPQWDLNTDKSCAMLKASWAFGIMCCLLFAVSGLAAFSYGEKAFRAKYHHRSGSTRRPLV